MSCLTDEQTGKPNSLQFFFFSVSSVWCCCGDTVLFPLDNTHLENQRTTGKPPHRTIALSWDDFIGQMSENKFLKWLFIVHSAHVHYHHTMFTMWDKRNEFNSHKAKRIYQSHTRRTRRYETNETTTTKLHFQQSTGQMKQARVKHIKNIHSYE